MYFKWSKSHDRLIKNGDLSSWWETSKVFDFANLNLQVVEPEKRSKTWGPKNGEHAQRELNRHSSSTSDMDKIGKRSKVNNQCPIKID